MEKFIACCGWDCALCEARIATLTNDDELREKTAERWRIQHNSPGLKAEMINCTGCRSDGIIFDYCKHCEIRLCVASKNYRTCGECDQLENCQVLNKVLQYVPDALENLKSLR